MKWRWVLTGGGVATILGLTGALAGIGAANINKPKQIDDLKLEIQDVNYPVIPPESRTLPKTGPSLPSPGYEN